MMELVFFSVLDNCKLSCVPSGIANAAQRGFSKAYFVDNISFAESTYQCAKTVILTMITKKAIPSNGSHANRIKALLQQQPIKTVVKLRDIGVDKESMLALARLLFTSTTDQAYVNVINSINDAY